jgi:5'-phosphate synthase pdxT subunit
VLGLQGDVEKHLAALERLGVRGRRVRAVRDLEGLAGLILPGGESTTMARGLASHDLAKPIQELAAAGGRLLGTCAGAILLARESRNHPVPTLGLLDVTAERNAYGTQRDSFVAEVDPQERGSIFAGMECVFIRAPRLCEPGPGIEVLARVDGEPVLLQQGDVWACSFHPELTDDLRVYRAWLGASD